jgi:hypothetical protein
VSLPPKLRKRKQLFVENWLQQSNGSVVSICLETFLVLYPSSSTPDDNRFSIDFTSFIRFFDDVANRFEPFDVE